MKSFCKVPTIPHKKLLVGRNGLNGIEVDAHPVLTRSQVLLLGIVRRIHVAHPVAFLLIKAIDEVVKLPSGVDLSKREDRRVEESAPSTSKNQHTHSRRMSDFWSPSAWLEKRIVSLNSLESAEIRAETGEAHFVSYLFHLGFTVFAHVGENNRRMKHKISFKKLPQTNETTRVPLLLQQRMANG